MAANTTRDTEFLPSKLSALLTLIPLHLFYKCPHNTCLWNISLRCHFSPLLFQHPVLVLPCVELSMTMMEKEMMSSHLKKDRLLPFSVEMKMVS